MLTDVKVTLSKSVWEFTFPLYIGDIITMKSRFGFYLVLLGFIGFLLDIFEEFFF